MKTITTTADIETTIQKFKVGRDGAFATCRCLSGQYAQENQQEWAERGTIEGKEATVYYILENSEAEVEDCDDMPFDVDHISRIVIGEE
jgi:hypothetical protein